MYLYEVKSTKLILQKVAYKHLQSTIFLRVDVSLCEHLVNLINRLQSTLVRTRHTLDQIDPVPVLNIHSKYFINILTTQAVLKTLQQFFLGETSVAAISIVLLELIMYVSE